MEAVILAGGKGTRLQPYTKDIPKPLVPVGGKMIIEFLLARLRTAGVRKVYIALGHLAHLIEAVLGDGERFGLEIVYSLEKEPLSTVGPLKLIPDLPETFLVANGDILTDLDLDALYEDHLKSGAKLTVATHCRTETTDYGVLELNAEHRVTGFYEKPVNELMVSMGVYVFSKSVLEYVPYGQKFGFDDLMLTLLDAGEPVNAFVYDGYWLDIGRPSDYEIANRDIDKISSLLE